MKNTIFLVAAITITAHAAFLGRTVPVRIVANDTSQSVTIEKEGSTQIAISVIGGGGGVFVTVSDTCTASRGTATRVNQNMLFPKGTRTVIARPSASSCIAVIAADTLVVDTVSIQLGVDKP